MYIGPLAGLFGAALASMSALKWLLLAFICVIVLWLAGGIKGSRSGLQERSIKDLVKSASQWTTRSAQDSNPLIALMNANYAMAYLNVARSVGSDSEIERYTGAAVDELLRDVEATQSNAIQRVSVTCPAVAPAGLAAAHSGWMSK